MANESIPFAKYPALLQLVDCHGINLGHTYRTPDSAKSFTGFISRSQHWFFLESHFCGNGFFSLLMGFAGSMSSWSS